MKSTIQHQKLTPSTRKRILLFGLPSLAFVAAAAIAVGIVAGNQHAAPETAGRLSDKTHMGLVEIETAQPDRLRTFYVDAVGLAVLAEDSDSVTLGSSDEPLIKLSTSDTTTLSNPSDAGLYHSAILFPTESALADALLRVSNHAPESFQGSADHAVSQAFYFGDPDGNGVELYVDRPRNEWVWHGDQVDMTTVALDVNEFISTHATTSSDNTSQAPDATMGHVHLKVGDLAEAEAFYSGVLGFDVTSRADGAVFYSAGGYHHHLATNTWNSAGAGQRPATAGLGKLTVVLENQAELESARDRLAAAEIQATTTGSTIVTADPWGTVVELTVR